MFSCMRNARLVLTIVFTILILRTAFAADSNTSPGTWYFAVSGDSRNCGDVVMPAIAADAHKHDVAFYWHLGDLRKISAPDQDFLQERTMEDKPTDLADYEKHAWDDFVENQIKPWGDTPFYLGIGNHEVNLPKTRAAFVQQFCEYLDRPDLKEQRLKDNAKAVEPKTYYHWMRDGIDFIYLDNASQDQFDAPQMKWIEGVLNRDRKDSAIHTIVYVLASHSPFFMDGIFNTLYWKSNGGVLPGWIVGTAGAERYPLPPDAADAKAAKTNVYGYLVATVNPAGEPLGTINFKFEELKEDKIPADVVRRFTEPFVHECFEGNRRTIPPENH